MNLLSIRLSNQRTKGRTNSIVDHIIVISHSQADSAQKRGKIKCSRYEVVTLSVILAVNTDLLVANYNSNDNSISSVCSKNRNSQQLAVSC